MEVLKNHGMLTADQQEQYLEGPFSKMARVASAGNKAWWMLHEARKMSMARQEKVTAHGPKSRG